MSRCGAGAAEWEVAACALRPAAALRTSLRGHRGDLPASLVCLTACEACLA